MTDRDRFAAFVHQDTAKVWLDFGVRMGEMMADMMDKRISDAMLRERGVTKPMPKTKRAEVPHQEPVAWAVFDGPDRMHLATGYSEAESCAEDIGGEIVPLYRKPTLTNDEEEAIRGALGWLLWCEQNRHIGDGGRKDIATLRGLLERLC